HDRHGPYLARIPLDEATWPQAAVTLALPWPAPAGGHHQSHRAVPAPEDGGDPLPQHNYHGIPLLRPRFWTLTNAVVPTGGFGALGVITDPLNTHTLVGSIGVGPVESEPVGLGSWSYRGWPIDIGVIAWRSEITYADEYRGTDGRDYDYTETKDAAELLFGRGIAALDRDFFGFVRLGIADWNEVDEAAEEYDGIAALGPPAFEGEERYVQVDLGYDDRFLFPDGYAPDAGVAALISLRHSGFDGELERNRALAAASGAIPIWRKGGHQLVVSGKLGTSDGDEFMQGNFSIGGAFGLGLPRGYIDRIATGNHLAGGSIAYRAALWRPFDGYGSSPLVNRQLVLEIFADAAQVSNDQPIDPDADWYRSVGGLLYTTWEFYGTLLQPGLGVAQQLDGNEDTTFLLELGFRW
ncbi:MAG: hypothetical protein PF961_13210, partial [Planctomycetota bacterium]|nr:hypothetical protein [Planctomycetota bacterium]